MMMTTRNHINYKCYYCNKGADRILHNPRKSNTKSKSLERVCRIISSNPQARSTSVTPSYLPSLVQELECSYTSGATLTADDLRQELVELKRNYAILIKEYGKLTTQYRVATKDVKHREMEIENLLQDPITKTKSQAQLELNSLKRKLIQTERALREKRYEIADILRNKNISNGVRNREKLIKLKKEHAQLKKLLEKSVPHAELEAEKARLSELINSLQRENDGLHNTLAVVLPEEETDRTLESKGLNDTKTLAKLRSEAGVRKQEVEHYQNLLATLIRDKTPLPVYSESRAIELPEVLIKNSATTKKVHSFKAKRDHSATTRKQPLSSKLESTPSGNAVNEKQPNKNVLNSVKSKVATIEEASQPTEKSKSIQNKIKDNIVQKVAVNRNNTKHRTATSETNSKNLKKYNKDFLKLQNKKETSASPSFLTSISPPVEMTNTPLRYVELFSSEPSSRIDTSPEQIELLNNSEYHVLSYESQGIPTHQLKRQFKKVDSTNGDTELNIEAIAAEYREKDMDERVDLLVIVLKCQLLREEMLQTRVMSF